MSDQYQNSIAGLASQDPQVVMDSAIWLVENSETVHDQDCYRQASEMLYAAATESIDCLRYIDEKMSKALHFKAQIFACLVKDGNNKEMQEGAQQALENLIQQAAAIKGLNTEMIAQIYSAIQETGHPALLGHAKKLL